MGNWIIFGVFASWIIIAIVASTAGLWFATRVCRVPKVTFRRSLAIAGIMAIVNLIVAVGDVSAQSFGVNLPLLLVLLGGVVSVIIIYMLSLKTSVGRSLVLYLIHHVLTLALALPLILGLRAVFVEGFYMPTGGMAPTLAGLHHEVRCPTCHFTRAVGADAMNRVRPRSSLTVTCPQCDSKVNFELSMVDGDRMLVDKVSPPQRWEVILFRSPLDPSMVYAQRLVGMPGETIEIGGGDVFVNGARCVKPPDDVHDLWFHVHDSDDDNRGSGAKGSWEPEVEHSLWKSTGIGWEFDGILTDAQSLKFSRVINDVLAYNLLMGGRLKPSVVGDVHVQIEVKSMKGDGGLEMEWKMGEQIATLKCNTSSGLELQCNDQAAAASKGALPIFPATLSLVVRDGVVSVLCNGEVAITSVLPARSPEEARAGSVNHQDAPCLITLRANHCQLEIGRRIVRRDVHYLDERLSSAMGGGNSVAGGPIVLGQDEYFVLGDNSAMSLDSRHWSVIHPNFPAGTGQVGALPGQSIVGVARVLYWPPRRWHLLN